MRADFRGDHLSRANQCLPTAARDDEPRHTRQSGFSGAHWLRRISALDAQSLRHNTLSETDMQQMFREAQPPR